jgi:hypothetical protein
MLAALDALIDNTLGGRAVIALRQVCRLFLRVGFEGTDESSAETLRLFDELMTTLAMDLDDESLRVLAPELQRLPGVLPEFAATVMSRFYELALRGDIAAPAAEAEMAAGPIEHAAIDGPAEPEAEPTFVRAAVVEPSPVPAMIERRATPRDPVEDATNLLTLARRATPEQMMRIAALSHLPEMLTGILVSRGHEPAIVTALANPDAAFGRSSLVTLAELAAGDRTLRDALVARPELPEEAALRLLPILGREARATLLMAGMATDVRLVGHALEQSEAGRQAIEPGIDDITAAIGDGAMSCGEAAARIANAGRGADLAAFAAAQLGVHLETCQLLLTARLDLAPAVLLRALDAPPEALGGAIAIRRRIGKSASRGSPVFGVVQDRLEVEEARLTVMMVDARLRASTDATDEGSPRAGLALAG